MPYFNQCSSKEVIRISGLLRFSKKNSANLDFSLKCGEQSFADADIVEPRYNEPLYNKVLDTTNDFLYPNNTDKIYEKKTPCYIAIKFCQPFGRSLNRGSTVCALDKYRSFLSRKALKARMDGQLYLVLLIERNQIWIDPVRGSIINFIQSKKSLYITLLLWTTFC